MGNLLSTLTSSLTSIKLLLTTLRTISTDFNTVLARIHATPGIPVGNPTTSFWPLLTPRPGLSALKPLAEQDTPDAGDPVEIAVIGSGITACAIVKTLLASPKMSGKRIVIVEAREVCQGATGRNGGHIKEIPFDSHRFLKKRHGKEAALEVTKFRLSHLEMLMRTAAEAGEEVVKECAVREVETVDAWFESEPWEDVKRRLEELLADCPEVGEKWKVWEGGALAEKFHLPTAVGVMTGPSGAISPYALVTGTLTSLLEKYPNFTIFPHTPITSISASSSHYILSTSSSHTIKARTIIHATNAHISHLVPGLRAKIFPIRAQMSAQTPGTAMPLSAGESRSWGFNWKSGFDYLTQLPASQGGALMYGGGWVNSGNNGMDEVGIPADDSINLFAGAHLGGLLPIVFGKYWGEERGGAKRVLEMWTGNIGFSADLLPWVGEVDEELTGRTKVAGGEWVAGGYSGEGMVNAWGCGVAVAGMVLGEDVVLPGVMRVGKERVAGANVEDLVEEKMF
ncbi:hypothetical protein RUND412_009830 [Rhizina undulata]